MKPTVALAVGALCACAAGSACAQQTIKDYLYNHSAGPVAANDIIQVSGSAVSGLQTPKDLVLALGSVGNRDSEAGFGIAVTPARTALLGLSADKYASGDVLSRIWGGTTFSYAQNKKKVNSVDYEQSAAAINVTWQLHAQDDPIVVAYGVFRGASAGPCSGSLDALEVAERDADTFVRRRIDEETAKKGSDLTLAELEKVRREATEQHAKALKALGELRNCAHKAADDVAKTWNRSRLQLVLGRGWIRSAANGSAPRLTLGKYATLAASLPAGADGLVNLTARRAADELDLSTIAAATPAYKSTNGMAARYTYRAGKSNDLYALAEVSNVKRSSATASNTAFKHALGIDRKVGDNLWLELRLGRSRVSDGTKLENKALLSLKFSPETTLDKQSR